MPITACRFCLAENNEIPAVTGDCYAHCAETEDGKHLLDPRIAQAADGNTDRLIIDVFCQKCSQSGSLIIDPEDVSWE